MPDDEANGTGGGDAAAAAEDDAATMRTAATATTSSLRFRSVVLPAFLLLTSLKVLLIPTYQSTDYDVHRNWLAITRHLPLSQWYFDDVNGTTVHTLDYPPGFAFFEAALSNNPITTALLRSGRLDGTCLALLPDASPDVMPTSDACLRFHRGTVILSDLALFAGAYIAAGSVSVRRAEGGPGSAHPRLIFWLIVTNPGLLMLDHVHFQYNGMLLGLLLVSVACVVRGVAEEPPSSPSQQEQEKRSLWTASQLWELGRAAAYAALLSMKHLYVTLAPLYFCYLLRRHCFVAAVAPNEGTNDGAAASDDGTVELWFSWKRLAVLGASTLLCLGGAFVPFLLQDDPAGQVRQMFERLFPFGRGLVHDYWAGNVWALYLFASRVATFLVRKASTALPPAVRALVEPFVPFPEPSPKVVALCLAAGLYPGGMHMAWRVGRRSSVAKKPPCYPGRFFVRAVVFCSLSSFMLGYHVHEKAILTAMLPLTLLATDSADAARLFLRTCRFGLFGLLPLLFRPEERLLKAALYGTWTCGATWALERAHGAGAGRGRERRTVVTTVDRATYAVLAVVFLFMEVIHPKYFLPRGKLEFLPLMTTSVVCALGLVVTTSVVCALGLVGCWVEAYHQMVFGSINTR